MSEIFILALFEQLLGHVDRPGQHDRRLRADVGEGADARARLQARRLAGLLRCRSARRRRRRRCRTNCRRGARARRSRLPDRLAIATASKPAISPICTNDGLSAPSDCMSVGGRMCSSRSSSVRPLTSLTGTIGLLEAALVPGLGGALLAFDRIGIDVVAREAVLGGDEVGRDALRHEIGRDRDGRIHRPGAARGADADAAHRFDAAADGHLVLPGHDLGGGEVHGVETRGAEAVDLHARHVVAVAGRRAPRRGRCRRPPRRPDRRSRAPCRRRARCRARCGRGWRSSAVRRELERRDLVQRAVRLAAPARGADVIVDECLGHGFLAAACRGAQARRRDAESCRCVRCRAAASIRRWCAPGSPERPWSIRGATRRPIGRRAAQSWGRRGCRSSPRSGRSVEPVGRGVPQFSQKPRVRGSSCGTSSAAPLLHSISASATPVSAMNGPPEAFWHMRQWQMLGRVGAAESR